MSQMFVIVLRPADAPDPWTAEAVAECYLTASEEHMRRDIGIAEVTEEGGSWAGAMLEANAQINNLGEPDVPRPNSSKAEESDPDEDKPLDKVIGEMTSIGALGITGWKISDRNVAIPEYANTAYAVRGFRFGWPHVKVMALVGSMEPLIEGDPDCNHDPSTWGNTPGAIECSKGCGAMWSAELAPTPDPHADG